jgi:hypothetical protein
VPLIPDTWKAEIGRIIIPSQCRQKVLKTPSQQQRLGRVACSMCLSSQLLRSINKRLMVQARPVKKAKPHLKNNQSKKV